MEIGWDVDDTRLVFFRDPFGDTFNTVGVTT
jgi:hypothetical protein